MNAIVEVVTAELVTETQDVVVTTPMLLEVVTSNRVATSTLRVVSMGSHSISAVAPDYTNFDGGLAEAA